MNGKKEVDVKEESVDEKEMKTDNDDEIKTDNSEEIKEVKEKKTDQPKKDEKSTSFFGMLYKNCLLYTSPSPRDKRQSRMPSSA